MSALPRPDLAPGPTRSLNDALHELHRRAGWPSLRALARRTGVSHTTVSKVFSAPALPPWGTLELLVEAMDGDTAHFHGLWMSASAPQGPGPAATAPRIAGRRTELAVVRRHLEVGRGLLLVTGEAGIGKTALLRAATASLDSLVLTATAYPSMTGESFAVVTDLLRQALELDEGTWFKAALADCPPYVAPALARILPEVGDDPHPDDEYAVARLFAAVRAIVEALGELRPYAWVVEDAHWADQTSLTHLERHLGSHSRVPVVATVRTLDLTPVAEEWLDRSMRVAVDHLDLAPLASEETAEQIALLTGREPSVEHVERVHRLTRGLPLFIDDLARWTPGTDLPHGLADSFDRRLRALPDDARTVVATVALAGRPLPAEVVGEVTGLDQLRRTEALRALDGARMLGRHDGDVALHHPLLAEAAATLLVPGEAAMVHAALARALARTEDPSAAEVAGHWQRAGAPHEELRWRVRAARVADGRLATAESCEHWMRVLELWDRRPGDIEVSRAEVVLACTGALMHAGREDETRPLVAEALAMAPLLPARQRAVAFRRASQNLKDHSPASGIAFARSAQAAFEALGDETGAVLAMCDQSCALRGSGRFEEARRISTAAAARARALDDPALLRDVLIEKAWHDVVAGHAEEGLRTADEATRTRTAPDPFSEVWTAVYHTDLLLVLGADAARVEAAAAPGLAAARHNRIESWVLSTTLVANVVEALLDQGLVARAGAMIDPLTEGPSSFAHRILHLARVDVDTARGRLDESAARLEELSALPFAGVGHVEGRVLTAATCALWSGRPDDAWALLRERFSRPGPPSWSPCTAMTLALAARAAADLVTSGDDPAVLHVELGRMRAAVSEDVLRDDAPAAVTSLARELWHAERARADGTDTTARWERVVAAADRLHRPHDAAYGRWRAAQCALREGRGTVAARLLGRAEVEAREHVPLSRAIVATARAR